MSNARAQGGSNVSWNAPTTFAKPSNVGGRIDGYRQKQNQLASSALEATDYSEYIPLSKKNVDMNNYGHKPDDMNPHKPITDL
jgi:hypothetical protein